jgi:hypothetical protein
MRLCKIILKRPKLFTTTLLKKTLNLNFSFSISINTANEACIHAIVHKELWEIFPANQAPEVFTQRLLIPAHPVPKTPKVD